MSTQSAENYLDELLNSVNGKKKQEDFKEEVALNTIAVDKVEDSEITRNTAKAEAEFLMEFEKELEGEDFDDFLREFDESDIQPEDRLEDADVLLNNFLDQFEDVPVAEDVLADEPMIQMPMEEAEPVAVEVEEKTSVREEISLEELAMAGIEVEEVFGDLPLMEEPELNASAGQDSIDLSQMGDEDLISLLAGAEDLADIGQLFEQSESNVPMEGEDPFATFAENEMAANEEATEVVQQDAKPRKKAGFLEKLSALLFGKEEEEEQKVEPVSITPDEMPGVIELSEENADILSLFETAEAPSSASNEPAGKDKKAKKEKKKKEPKPKAPKKPKAEKPKKEKKPKEKDNTPPLPKGPVALVCLLAISIFVLVFWGTDLISYNSVISKADALYKGGQYAEAAEVLAGVTIKEEDSVLYAKIMTLATVDSQLSEYEIFMKHERKTEALDSLISAAGRCALNEDNALASDCAGEMGLLLDRVTVELQEEFGLSFEEAADLYALTEYDRAEYTKALHKIYVKLGLIKE